MKMTKAALFLSACCLSYPALAQDTQATTPDAATPTGAATPQTGASETESEDSGNEVLVTGSRIRQDPNNSALPLQIITTQELSRNGISNPEQLIGFLTTNGSGADNLASNSDVVSGAQRGTNGLSAANLRGQGPAATLVLLNGRRVAAHGLSGGAVDVNQIPFAAIDRVEVLKDGASAIYGTDAVGGVINFITKKTFTGLQLQGFVDATEQGDANIYRVSATAGYGDLSEDGFNVMGAVSYSSNQILRGSDRDFVNTFQPDRGLSPDTRGTPIATVFPINPGIAGTATNGGVLLGGTTGATLLAGLVFPGTTQRADGGINVLDLPGGAGCGSVDGGGPYDEQIWLSPAARFACAWDTGRAAALQQPIDTLTYYGRAVARLGGAHEISLEVTGSDADSAKSFSNAQVSTNTTNFPAAYPRNALTAATYDAIFSQIAAVFPAITPNFGRPIAFRWRCIACGPREYVTNTKTLRGTLAIEGPLFEGWDYRAGASYARSESASVLGSGYYYRGTLANGANDPSAPTAPGATGAGLVGLINAGILNPFAIDQSAAGIAGLNAISARGTTLYGGQYEVKQFDGSVSGPLFDLWGGTVQAAVGVDYRRETYEFNGSPAAAATAPNIFLAAFDNVNALTPQNRDVKAVYAEVLFPLLPGLDITGAIRYDDYSRFGSTTNPKVSVKYRPFDMLLLRGSYNTSFRVPTFNQLFNGVTESVFSGSNFADPVRCPQNVFTPNAAIPNCGPITPSTLFGGNPNLDPETAEQFNLGIVIQPTPRFSASVDFWQINVDNSIQELLLRDLLTFGTLFPDRFIRDATGTIVQVDRSWINAGARRTRGLEVALRGGIDAFGGQLNAGLDGTYLLKKTERLTSAAAEVDLVGRFSLTGDLGLKWKHNAFVSYSNDDITVSLTQIYRDGYRNFQLLGVAAGTVTRPDLREFVDEYIIYNATIAYTGIDGFRLTAGMRNIFDTDPPFAITYDTGSGAGSSWEPRVADPRGRSFTISAEVKF